MNQLPILQKEKKEKGRFPKWLHRKLPKGKNSYRTDKILEKYQLNTVCEEAKCPNRSECYTKQTATFLALGSQCTRSCSFCDIDFSKNPIAPKEDEPERIAYSAKELGLKHVVITMVARDDLPDKGASHIAKIIDATRQVSPESTIEVLTSDFSGDLDALQVVLDAKPEIFNHNLETVESLTSRVRHKATYKRTIQLLSYAKRHSSLFIKSGLMLGLGESNEEVKQSLSDLQEIGCDIVTLGQYLQASKKKIRVKEFISPDAFAEYKRYGETIGIPHVYAGPFVRSSYNASSVYQLIKKSKSFVSDQTIF